MHHTKTTSVISFILILCLYACQYQDISMEEPASPGVGTFESTQADDFINHRGCMIGNLPEGATCMPFSNAATLFSQSLSKNPAKQTNLTIISSSFPKDSLRLHTLNFRLTNSENRNIHWDEVVPNYPEQVSISVSQSSDFTCVTFDFGEQGIIWHPNQELFSIKFPANSNIANLDSPGGLAVIDIIDL